MKSLMHAASAAWIMLVSMHLVFPAHNIVAQTAPTDWSPPRPINTQCCAAYPVPVIDPWGQLHLLWADADGYIWHAKRVDDGWSQILDVVANPGGGPAAGLDASVDKTGHLHLIWRDGSAGGALYYSSVAVQEAGNAHAWRGPTELAPKALGAAIAVDQNDIVHVTYTPFEAGESFVHISSLGGVGWSQPTPAPSFLDAIFTGGSYVSLAADDAGVLHVTWNSQAYPAGYPEHAVYYQRSADGGQTWSDPFDPDPLPPEVDSNYDSNFKNKMLNVAIGPSGDVHLTWHQYTGYRFHRWSSDGGLTWNDIESVFPDMGAAFNGVVDMAFDSSGRMYVVAARGGIWSRSWNASSQWTPPTLVDPNPADWHHQRVAVVGGNQVYLFYPDINETGILWFTQRMVDAPAVAPAPLPAASEVSATPNLQPTGEPNQVKIPQTSVATTVVLPEEVLLAPGNPVMVESRWTWALLPALLLVGVTVASRLMLARRR